jgi:hypothetical protein
MKHIKIAFALLAVIFISFSSFKSTGKVGDVKLFNFIGSSGTDEMNPQAYEVTLTENTACDGEESTLCQIRVESDDIDGLHPKEAVLQALIAEAATVDPEVFEAGDGYLNGEVIVQEQP